MTEQATTNDGSIDGAASALSAGLAPTTLCWNCNTAYQTDARQCPGCCATNANKDLASAQEELRKEEQMGGPVNCNDSELSIYLQALAEGYLPTFYSDTSQSAQSKSMSIASKSFRRGKKTVVFHGFPSLKMSRHSTEDLGTELLTSWLAAFRVKTSALPETARGLTENAVGCGTTWPASLAKFDPDTSSWKTAQLSLLGGLEEFSQTWPRWGLMRAGECWERQTLVPRTSESASGLWRTPSASVVDAKSNVVKLTGRTAQDPQVGLADQVLAKEKAKWPTPNCDGYRSEYLGMTEKAASSKRGRAWPTPTVCGNYNRKEASATSGDGLATAVATSLTMSDLVSTDAQTAKARMYPTATATAYKGWSPNHNRAETDDRLDYTIEREAFSHGQQTPPMRLNPDWVEWLMGWPIGHTDLKPLGTDRFQEWLRRHGGF